MKLPFYILLPLIVLLLTGCSSDKTHKSLPENINGKWQLIRQLNPDFSEVQTDDQDLHISFNTKQKTFSSNFFGNSPGGSFILAEKDSTFGLIPYLDSLTVKVDSSIVVLNKDENKLNFYHNGQHLGFLENGGFKQEFGRLNFVIKDLHQDNMVIVSEFGTSFLKRTGAKLAKFEAQFSVMSIFRGFIGILTLVALCWFFSENRKQINWDLVIKGLALQLIIALLVLKVPFVEQVFAYVSGMFVKVIDYTYAGTSFLFGVSSQSESDLATFAFKILPTIIFFSALMSILYYWGILQKIVMGFAWIMKKIMKLSGAESLAAAGNVFLGQTESPLLVKPYLLGMSRSEITCLMTGGMATIAGGVLAAYIGFLGGDSPEEQAFFAKHLLTASIISAPAAVVAAKILVPETDVINEDLAISKDKIGSNLLEAISNGTSDGLRLAVNVGAMLLVFIALMACANGILSGIGDYTGLNNWIVANTPYKEFSFQFILGYLCAPIVWLMGVEWKDCIFVGELLGQKTILNEFIAYPRLGELKESGLLSEKSIIMSTYMLCGFANFASIGIQIGGIGALVPSRKGLLSELGIKALIGGTVACLLTSVVIGMLL